MLLTKYIKWLGKFVHTVAQRMVCLMHPDALDTAWANLREMSIETPFAIPRVL